MADGYIMKIREKIGHSPLVVACASVIIYDESRGILLQNRKDNRGWSHHGGSIEPNESAEEAAKRELFEEIGLQAGQMQLYTVASGPEQHFFYPNGDEVHIVNAVFTCKDFSGKIILEESEVTDCQWFAFDQLPENISSSTKSIILQFAQEMLSKNG